MRHLKKIRATGCAALVTVLLLSGCVQENRVNTLLQSEVDSSQTE
jgi:outer membrane murein-binding lipoprotein Lpp